MTDIQMADISEWQPSFNADTYLDGGYQCIICRTHNGNRIDNMMPDRRDYIRSKSFTAVGWYQYLVPDRSASDQAHEFITTIGELRGNEFPVLDLEAGSGNQTPRAEEWFRVVDPWAGFKAMMYAGDYFLRNQLSGADYWGERPLWIASYPNSYQPSPGAEPSQKHLLWQFSDRQPYPGLPPGDGNIAHCSAQEFLAAARGGAAAPAVPEGAGAQSMITVVKADGRLETFVEDESGHVWHAWQTAPNAGWAGSTPGKTATWYSLGRPGG